MKSIRHTCACIFRLIYSHCFMKYTQQSHQKSPSTGAYYRPTNVPHIHQVMLYTLLHIPRYTEIRKMFIVLYDFSFLHQPVYRFIQSSGVYERAPARLNRKCNMKKIGSHKSISDSRSISDSKPWRLSFNGFYMQKCTLGFMLQILWVIWGGAVA